MKTTASLLTLLALASQLYAGNVIWNSSGGEIESKEMSLSSLKEEVSTYMQDLIKAGEQGYVESIYIKNSTITIDSTSLFQVASFVEGEGQGGPSLVTFGQGVRLEYDTPLTFVDVNVGFQYGEQTYNPDKEGDDKWETVPGSLTVNLTSNFIERLNWQSNGASDVYTHVFMQCSFFENYTGLPTMLLNNRGANTEIAGFTFKGYVASIEDLNDGEIAVIAVREQTEWMAGTESWPGLSLALVAKSSVGAPDLPTPEPTTGTLSLLALAGLAARRRRK